MVLTPQGVTEAHLVISTEIIGGVVVMTVRQRTDETNA
jgi:hypothetical protein